MITIVKNNIEEVLETIERNINYLNQKFPL